MTVQGDDIFYCNCNDCIDEEESHSLLEEFELLDEQMYQENYASIELFGVDIFWDLD